MDSHKSWIIMLVLIVGILIFLLVTSLRDKKKKKVDRKEYNSLTSDANIKKDELMMELSAIIKLTTKDLAEFKPSVGRVPMSNIVNKSKILVKNLKNSKSFAAAIQLEVNELELNEIFKELGAYRANHWNKKCVNIITIIQNHVEDFTKDNKENKDQYLAVLKRYRKIWDEIKF